MPTLSCDIPLHQVEFRLSKVVDGLVSGVVKPLKPRIVSVEAEPPSPSEYMQGLLDMALRRLDIASLDQAHAAVSTLSKRDLEVQKRKVKHELRDIDEYLT
jgi:hypothetical protein